MNGKQRKKDFRPVSDSFTCSSSYVRKMKKLARRGLAISSDIGMLYTTANQ